LQGQGRFLAGRHDQVHGQDQCFSDHVRSRDTCKGGGIGHSFDERPSLGRRTPVAEPRGSSAGLTQRGRAGVRSPERVIDAARQDARQRPRQTTRCEREPSDAGERNQRANSDMLWVAVAKVWGCARAFEAFKQECYRNDPPGHTRGKEAEARSSADDRRQGVPALRGRTGRKKRPEAVTREKAC
jgi:hypothetical protein